MNDTPLIDKIIGGELLSARQQASPNFNQRPSVDDISVIVVHNISLPPEEFGGSFIEDFFSNSLDCRKHPYFSQLKTLKVSSHLLIDRLGQVVQFVNFLHRAWHAGQSRYQGRDNCNDFSIGIELEGSDLIPYTAAQYQSLAEVAAVLIEQYPLITADRIVGHSDIAPQRKSDPGPAFDWNYFQQRLRERLQ